MDLIFLFLRLIEFREFLLHVCKALFTRRFSDALGDHVVLVAAGTGEDILLAAAFRNDGGHAL